MTHLSSSKAAHRFPRLGRGAQGCEQIFDDKVLMLRRLAEAAESASMFHINKVTQELEVRIAGYKGGLSAEATPPEPTKGERSVTKNSVSSTPSSASSRPSQNSTLGAGQTKAGGRKEA